MNRLPFVKMHGAGNDFVVVDNRAGILAEAVKADLARRVTRRRLDIGADGLILIELPEDAADYRMRYYNADGSEGELCGNGTRCAALFAREIGAAGDRQRIATPAGRLVAEILPGGPGDATVQVVMASPGPIRRVRLPDLPGGEADLQVLDVGVPHAVEVVPDVGAVDVAGRGRAIRRNPAFPAGANANFLEFFGDAGEIRLRTWERGVEAESLACGTGATAAVTVAHRFHGWPPVVPVRMASGDLVHIDLTGDAPVMRGPVTRVFDGILSLAGASRTD